MADDVTNISTVEEEERIDPIVLTNKKTGNVYVLEFNRESVEFAESRFGIRPQMFENELGSLMIRNLFYCAFRMHQPKVSKAETDKILENSGITADQLVQLCRLYELPYTTLIVSKEQQEKNSEWTMG